MTSSACGWSGVFLLRSSQSVCFWLKMSEITLKGRKTPKNHMSLVTRKPVLGVCDQVRLKPACSAIETSKRLEILHIETTDINYLNSE